MRNKKFRYSKEYIDQIEPALGPIPDDIVELLNRPDIKKLLEDLLKSPLPQKVRSKKEEEEIEKLLKELENE